MIRELSRATLAVWIVCTVIAATATPAFGQIPARFYWKSLIGGRAVPVIGMSLSGNANPVDPAQTVLPDANVEATVVIAGYAQTFTLFDRAAMVAVLVPMGRLSGDVVIDGQTFGEASSGYGDPLVEFNLNLIGPDPIRNIPDLMRYEPGFSLDIIGDVAFPLGEYNNNQSLNLGQNRWYGRVGAPIVWQLGPWIPGRRTTLEFLPSVWFFSDNDDFVGRTLSTKPMFQLESHLTRDFVEDLWGSFDVAWITGGKASLDRFEGEKLNMLGVGEGEKLNMLGVGYTLGYQINENLQLTGSYTATVNDDEPTDLRMDGFKVSLVFGWHPLIEGMQRLGG